MEPFEVYKLYLALKLHFTTEKYDITKTRGAVKASEKAFLKRKDIIAMRKLARDYKKKEIIDLLVANFVSGDKWGGMFDTQSSEIYKEWKARKSRRDYQFEQDVELIRLEMEKQSISDPFVADQGHHALVYRLYLGKKITIESLVLLDKLFDLSYKEEDDIFLKDISMLIRKYRPFVKLTDKMRYVGENIYK
jgi:hypothetical protein